MKDIKSSILTDYETLVNEKNKVSLFYNGIYERYKNPVLTACFPAKSWFTHGAFYGTARN